MQRLKSTLGHIVGRSAGVQSRLSTGARVWTAVIVAVLLVGRPAHLESLLWWRSAAVVASLGLTTVQAEQIDQLYQERLLGRRRCIERLVAASNRVDHLLRDGAYDENTLKEVQAVMKAAADERALMRAISEEIAALLSAEQRRLLARLHPGHLVE